MTGNRPTFETASCYTGSSAASGRVHASLYLKGKKHYSDRPCSKALVSIHDVMPETLDQVLETVRFLENEKVFPVTLLVTPGRQWSSFAIEEIKSLQRAGYALAGHGWLHEAERFAGFRHRLHGLLISGKEAEHLCLSPLEIEELMLRGYDWFSRAGLEPPLLYVPPAWAMGGISEKRLKRMPYQMYETQTGIRDTVTGRFYPMPVTGYMADTPFRSAALRVLNMANLAFPAPCIRIAIHPEDIRLPLAGDLRRHLRSYSRYLDYTEMVGINSGKCI
ncbi:MAG: polysaccharide deacetylase family protein [Thermodesulfobacteriota bacterium]